MNLFARAYAIWAIWAHLRSGSSKTQQRKCVAITVMNKLKSVVDILFSLNHHTATLDKINKGNTRNKNVNLEQTTR